MIKGEIMKKIKQLLFTLFIFSVLALSYLVTSISAQGGSGINGGECDPNPACVENCCDECDPNPACVENCCPAESPENPNNDPGSSGSDTATFCPNCGPDSLGQRGNIPRKPTGNITRNPRRNILRKPTGKIIRHPSGTITRKPTGKITRHPRNSNGNPSIPNIQGIEDKANRRPQSRTSTPLFVPPRGTEPNVRLELQTNISCENIRSEIVSRLETLSDRINGLPHVLSYGTCALHAVRNGQDDCANPDNLDNRDFKLYFDQSNDLVRELFEYIDANCL